MKKSILATLDTRFPEGLELIGAVKFTSRQIDILACLICGKNPKTISSLLSISFKTVDTHIENIKQRIGCFSRQNIINFTEKSGKTFLLQQHYLALSSKFYFEKVLQKVSLKIKTPFSICLWGEFNDDNLPQLIENHLNQAGFKVIKVNFLADKDSLKNSSKRQEITLCCFSEAFLNIRNKSNLSSKLKCFENKRLKNPGSVIPLVFHQGDEAFVSENLGTPINFEDPKKYFENFFELLKRIIPDANLENLIEDFKEQYSTIWNIPSVDPLNKGNEENSFKTSFLPFDEVVSAIKNKKLTVILGGVGFSVLFILGGFFFLHFPPKNELAPNSVRSELLLPERSSFLARPKLLDLIKNKLEMQNGIRKLALVGVVGMGGAGKTTLARLYGKLKQKAPIVWELNAETRENLISSYESLAYTLANTEDLRKQIIFIENIQKPKEKEKQVLNFVKKLLIHYPNWVLIYDNVEEFSEIRDLFPYNAKDWGQGNVIITTRDGNIHRKNYLKFQNIVRVDELNPKETLTLLSKVLYNKFPRSLSAKKREEMLTFLKNIPPFPLDIMVAGHYMKNNHINFAQYIKRVRNYSSSFYRAQESLLKEMSDYTKTRYGIINSTFEKIISENKIFGELLLIICLLDSQNIPKGLLKKYISDLEVDNFIKCIRKNGLITHELVKGKNFFFSIHRSTQALGLALIANNYLKQIPPKRLRQIIESFEKYIDDIIETEGLHNIKPLARHMEVYLSHDILNKKETSIIRDKLGYIYYYYFRMYNKAKLILEDQLREAAQYNQTKRFPFIKVILSSIYFELGEINKIYPMIEDITSEKLNFQENIPKTARLLGHLGYVYAYIGKIKESSKLLESSLNIYETIPSKKYPGICRTLTYLGNTYRKLGAYQKALQAFERSFQLYKKFFPEGHADLPWVFLYLGCAYKDLGNFEKAIKYLQQSLDMYQKYLANNHQDIALPLLNLGIVYLNTENYQMAEKVLKKAHEIFIFHFSEDHINSAYVASYLGNLYRLTKKFDTSQKILEKSFKTYSKNFDEDSSRLWRILYHLGCLYTNQGKFKKAEKVLKKSLSILRKNKHPLIYQCLESLGDLYFSHHQNALKRGDLNLAKLYKNKSSEYYKEALNSSKSILPMDNRYIQKLLVKFG